MCLGRMADAASKQSVTQQALRTTIWSLVFAMALASASCASGPPTTREKGIPQWGLEEQRRELEEKRRELEELRRRQYQQGNRLKFKNINEMN